MGSQFRNRCGADDEVLKDGRQYLPSCEIIELHHDKKLDAPIGNCKGDGTADSGRKTDTA